MLNNILLVQTISYFWLIGNCSCNITVTLHKPIISMMSFIGQMTVGDIFVLEYHQSLIKLSFKKSF